MKGKEHKM